MSILAFGLAAAAANSGVTYQGRILKPDGSPLSGLNAQFKLQLRTPDGQNCLMYEEVQSQDMSHSNGAFSLTINDGSGSRTDTTSLTLDRIFANHGSFTLDASTCSTGSGIWAPNVSDGRNLVVLFKDETMTTWEPIPAQKINFVPLAFEAKQVQGFTASSLVRVAETDGTLDIVSPLSNANYTELLALVNGTTTQYSKSNKLNGVALPTMSSGQVLGWNGSAWVSQDPVPSGGVSSSQIASGAVGTTQIANNVSISTTGTVATAVTTTRDFKIFAASPSTYSIDMQAPALTASYSLVWPMTAGSSGQVLTTDGSGGLSWTAGGAVSSQWATNGSNISYLAGNVGIGTTSPTNLLHVRKDQNAATTVIVQNGSSGAGASTGVILGGDGIQAGGANGYNAGMLVYNGPGQAPDNCGGGGFICLPNQLELLSWSGVSNGILIGTQYYSWAPVKIATNGYERMRIDPYGNVGIGTTAPTAKLTLAGGSTAVGSASLKLLPASAVMTTPEDGAMEYASSNLYYTIGSTRYVIPLAPSAGNYSNVSSLTGTAAITMTPGSGNSVIVNSTTVSTSATTGALIVSGGVGISGALNTSGNITSGGAVTATTNVVTPQLYGSTAASGNIRIDGTSNATAGNVYLASAGGQVGIGTTTPSSKLDIAATGTGTTINVNRGSATSGIEGVINLGGARNGGGSEIGSLTFTNYDTAGTSADFIAAKVNAVKNTPDSADLTFSTAFSGTLSEVMRITKGGNIGIGTTSPTSMLHIAAALSASSGSDVGIQLKPVIIESGTAGYNAFIIDTTETSVGSGSRQFMSMRVGGVEKAAVGVSGTFYSGNGLANNSTSAYASFGTATTGPLISRNQADAYPSLVVQQINAGSTGDILQLKNSATTVLNVQQSGKVGIGTTSPAAALDVAGSGFVANFGAASVGSQTFVQVNSRSYYGYNGVTGNAAIQGSSGKGIEFNVNNSTFGSGQAMTITSAGSVGIGTTSPQAKLQVAGAIVSTPSTVSSGATVDLTSSNTVVLASVGGSTITLSNMVHGGNYTLVVQDTNSRTYTFTGCNSAVYKPANAATTAGSQTIYTILTVYNGSSYDCYVTWASGYL